MGVWGGQGSRRRDDSRDRRCAGAVVQTVRGMTTFDDVDAPRMPRQKLTNPLANVSDESDSGTVSPVSTRMQKSEMRRNAALMAPVGRVLNPAERKWLQDKWFALETSGDGMLQFDETKALLRDLKKKMSDEEINRAFEEMDTDGCGSVDFDEFYMWFAHQDAEEFAHLMLHGAHSKVALGFTGIGFGMVVPCSLIIFVSGPDPLVSQAPSHLASVLCLISERVCCVDGAACGYISGEPL